MKLGEARDSISSFKKITLVIIYGMNILLARNVKESKF